MNKILKQILTSIVSLSLLLSYAPSLADEAADISESPVTNSDEIQISEESSEMTLSDGGVTVIPIYNGEDESLKAGGNYGYGEIFSPSEKNIPFRAPDDGAIKFYGTALAKNASGSTWGLDETTHGSSALKLPASKCKSVTTKKFIIEFDYLAMCDNNGVSFRFTKKESGKATVGGDSKSNIIYSGKAFKTGVWNKFTYVLPNDGTDKSYQIYLNGELFKEGDLGSTGIKDGDITLYIHAVDDSPIEMYIDNLNVIAADSAIEYEISHISSEESNITVSENEISVEYGLTAGSLKDGISTDGSNIFVGKINGEMQEDGDLADENTSVACVSADGIYTYYSVNPLYIPGDSYRKITLERHSADEISIGNLSGISNAAAAVFAKGNDGNTADCVYFYPIGESGEHTFSLRTPAAEKSDIGIVVLNGVTNFDELTEIDENSGITLDLAVESGMTVSGDACSKSDVIMMVLKPDTEFSSNVLKNEGISEDVYHIAGTKADDEGKFVFDTVSFSSSGIYTYVLYFDGNAYITKKFAPGKQAIIDFKKAIDEMESASDIVEILDADCKTGDTGFDYTYYNALSPSERLKVCEDITNAMDLYNVGYGVNLDEFAQQFKFRTMIPAMVKTDFSSNPAETVLGLLDTDNEIFNLSGSAVDSYNLMEESEKRSVCSYICANPELVKDPETLLDSLNIGVVNTELEGFYTHSDAFTILEKHSDFLNGINFEDYKNLKNTKVDVNQSVLKNRPYSSAAELADKTNKSVKSAKAKEASQQTNDNNKTSGGGGGGGGVSSGKTVTSDIPLQSGGSSVDSTSVFNDIDDVEWAQEAINVLYKKGIISGKGNGTFDPHGNITREEFVKLVVKARGLAGHKQENPFSDVDKNAWYGEYVLTAAENGITSGIGDGRFGVGQYITRQDMMVMCRKLLNEEVQGIDLSSFADAEEIADYAKDAVSELVSLNIVSGDGVNLSPSSNCTRAQAAKIIYLVLNRSASN